MHINKVVVTLIPVCGASVVVMEIVHIVVMVCKHVLNQSFFEFYLNLKKVVIVLSLAHHTYIWTEIL